MIKYFSKQDILAIHFVAAHDIMGRHFHDDSIVLNKNALEYLVEAPQLTLSGEECYPTIYHKAAVYAFNIIQNHIFIDGNKRTGILAMFTFLEMNDYQSNPEMTNDLLVNLAVDIAEGNHTIESISKILKAGFQDKRV